MLIQFTVNPKATAATVLSDCQYSTQYQTAVVIGLPQGGTSVLAAVIDALGVPIARPDGHFFNFEGQENRPYVGDSFEDWTRKISEWNVRADVWGFKDTIVWRHEPTAAHQAIRNPYFVIASRDAASIMQRRCANHAVVLPEHCSSVLREVREQQDALWKWIDRLPACPKLLVSYERAVKNREETCTEIAQFLRIDPGDERLALAVSRISPIGGYLRQDAETDEERRRQDPQIYGPPLE